MYPFHKRDEWATRQPAFNTNFPLPKRDVFVHHTASAYMPEFSVPAMQALENSEIARGGYIALAYHTLFMGDGTQVESRPVNVEGGATINNNSTSIAVCFPGNYLNDTPSFAQQDSVASWLAGCVTFGVLTPDFALKPHKAVFATACPGVWADLIPSIRSSVDQKLADTPPSTPLEARMVITIDGITHYAVGTNFLFQVPAVPNAVRVTLAQFNLVQSAVNQAAAHFAAPPPVSGQGGVIDLAALSNAVADKLAARLAS